MLRVAVTDTGIGIAPDMHERIFGDFIQADSSIARRYGGTGLGLAICRRIADLLGGTLTVDSAPGAGSTFRLAVPVTPGTAKPETPAPVVAGPALSVLVVDDDPINRAVAAGLLGRLGHRVTLADGGQAAIEAAAAAVLRRGDDGPAHAGHGRAGGHAADPRPAGRPRAAAHPGADRRPDRRQPAALRPGRHRAHPGQAAAAGRAAAHAGRRLRTPARRPRSPLVSADPTALVDQEFYDERHEILGIRELARLALMFHRVSRPLIEAIGAATEAGDRRDLARLAHRLSSSAGALGLIRLARHASAIEVCAGNDAPIDGLMDMAAALGPLRRLSVDALMAEMRRTAAQRPFGNALA